MLQRDAGRSTHGRPAFVAGNGPSLTASIERIREFREQIVLFSCGTTTSSLIKAGLRPDIHVEVERASETQDWITAATTQEDRDAMILLGLNTVHPDVYGLFPNRGMAMKPSDLGTAYVEGRVSRTGKVMQLDNCNPTVGNCATALAAQMGFEEVYLVGMDFGFPDGDKHRSKLSIHYKMKEEDQEELGFSVDSEREIKTAPGNFGTTVCTNALYIAAGKAEEHVVADHPRMTCAHVSAGLKIEGTRAMRPDEIKLDNAPFDTKAVAAQIVERAFARDGLRALDRGDTERVFSGTADALAELEAIAAVDIDTVEAGLDVLKRLHDRIVALVSHDGDEYSQLILKGSVNVFSLLLAQALHRTRDAAQNVEIYRDCRDRFLAFCRLARTRVSGDMLRLDERRRDLEAMLSHAP